MDALVERARTGDAEAWEALYRRAYPRLLAYASRRLASPDDARDAVSEAMARSVSSISSFRGEGAGFDAWLYGILRYVVMDLQRQHGRRSDHPVPEEVDLGPQPGDELVRGDDRDLLRRAFARLSPADQEVLELRVVAGLRADDVAKLLGRRPGAVRMAQNRALRRLHALLEREGHDDQR